MIHLDTSVLVDALTGQQRSGPALRRVLDVGTRLEISTIVLFEWLRGPRSRADLSTQEGLFPRDAIVPFDAVSAARAAALYRSVRAPRGRELDLAIAACAIEHSSSLWTLNADDFKDIPGLILYNPSSR